MELNREIRQGKVNIREGNKNTDRIKVVKIMKNNNNTHKQ